MRGFDEDYLDIVDYIIRCTHRIWEERGVGLIYTHYAHNSVIHSGLDETYGREAVVVNTLQTLAAFPDRKLYGDEVIWSGDDEAGFHTSHLLTTISHNTGYGTYGPPTGRRVVWRAIANCFVRENMIIEEWLLRDEIAVIRQLGLDENAVAERQAAAALGRGVNFLPRGPIERGLGQFMPDTMPASTATGFDPDDFVRRAFHEIWNWRLFGKVNDYYAPNYLCHAASDRELYGLGDFTQDIMARIAAFPDATMHIDDLYWNDDGDGRYRTAVLWTMIGTHTGPGSYGPPTGRRVRILGITNHIVRDGRFVEEWSEWGEFNLLKQLTLPLQSLDLAR